MIQVGGSYLEMPLLTVIKFKNLTELGLAQWLCVSVSVSVYLSIKWIIVNIVVVSKDPYLLILQRITLQFWILQSSVCACVSVCLSVCVRRQSWCTRRTLNCSVSCSTVRSPGSPWWPYWENRSWKMEWSNSVSWPPERRYHWHIHRHRYKRPSQFKFVFEW